MKLLINTYFLLFCLGFAQNGFAQNTAPNQREFQLTIKPAKMAIKLDGVMDEEAWNTVEFVTDFKKNFQTILAPQKNRPRLSFYTMIKISTSALKYMIAGQLLQKV